MSGSRQFVLWIMLAIPFTFASAQVQVLPEMPITASGSVSTAYVHSNTEGGLDTLNLGLTGDINGYYYNPNFLQFQVSPYYDLGREFSETEFVTGGKGVGATANVFAGSSFPLSISYHRAKTSEATYNLLGSPGGIGGDGTSQDFSVNWTLRLRRLPTLQLAYLKNDGDFTVLGTDARGDSHGAGYSISSTYSLLGFALVASYDSNNLAQMLPDLFTSGGASSIDTKQKNLRFGINRNLWHSSYFDASASRAHWTSDATGKLEDRTFDSASVGINTRVTSEFSTSAHVNYSSDLTGMRIASLLSGSQPADTGGLFPFALTSESRFKTLIYSEGASYSPGHGFRFQASAQQGTGSDTSGSTTDTSTINGQVNYMRQLFGGSLSASYGFGLADTTFQLNNAAALSTVSGATSWSGTTIGHSGTLAYSHQVGARWGYTGSFHYSDSDSEGNLLLNTRSFGGELGIKSRIFGWNLTGDVRVDKIEVAALTSTDSLQKSFRVGLAKGPLSIAASQQFTSGFSIVTATGLRFVPVSDQVAIGNSLGNLITPTSSRASSLTATYVASKRLEFDANWMRTSYGTILASGDRYGLNDQLDFAVKYRFRQLDCRAGYRRYFQQFSGVLSDFNAQTVYFQVSRRFRVF